MATITRIFRIEGNRVYGEDSGEIGHTYTDRVCDGADNVVLELKGNTIRNKFDTVVAEVKDGKVLGASGYEYTSVAGARVPFKSGSGLSDVQVAALWLWLVRGMG